MPTLHWIGKEKVINHHMDVPFKVLNKKYDFGVAKDENENPLEEYVNQKSEIINRSSGNKIIHGDNLEALKALLPEYEGRVKCIYIDPPYNTGNEGWVYNDNVNDPKMKKWLGQVVGKESEDLSRHDKWLCMMYPRLKLLHKLLADQGSLVISIGYQEVFNLMPILRELFATKQIACVTVQTSGGKPSGAFNYQHEYLVFIMPKDFDVNPMSFTGGRDRTPFEGLTLATFDKTQRPNQTYPIFVNVKTGGLHSVGESLQERIKKGNFVGESSEFDFDFSEAPKGTVAVWPITSKGKHCVWRLTPSRLLADWEKGYIKIGVNRQKNSLNKYSIQYLPAGVIRKIEKGELKVDGKEPDAPTLSFSENKTVGSEIPTIWLEKEFHSVKGTTLLHDIFLSKKFNYPKPFYLICEILQALTSKDDIILDSFAGSGTTAHAVLNLNKQDGGNRKFILIEMEDYAESITAERVKRVIKGYNKTEGTDGSFDYYELGQPVFLENGNLNELVGEERIREYVYYTETKQPLQATNEDSRLTIDQVQSTNEEEIVSRKSKMVNPKSKIVFPKSYLGTHNDTAYYFHYEADEVTTLDHGFLASVTTKAEQYVIYADNCLLTKPFLTRHNIIFKKIPRDITRF